MALLPALEARSVAPGVPQAPAFTRWGALTPPACLPLTASAQSPPVRRIMLGLPAVLLVEHLLPVLLGLSSISVPYISNHLKSLSLVPALHLSQASDKTARGRGREMEETMWGSPGRSTVKLLAPAPLSLPSHHCSLPVS
eukprot:3309421-Rhodomonas_salina.1